MHLVTSKEMSCKKYFRTMIRTTISNRPGVELDKIR